MSTLVLAHDSPAPALGGGALRVLHQSRQLARHLDDDVTVVALGRVDEDAGEPFRLEGVAHEPSRAGVLVRAWRRPYLEVWSRSPALDARVRAGTWDLVVATSPFVVPAARLAGVPVVLDAANLEHEVVGSLAVADTSRVARLRWRWEAAKVRRLEQEVAHEVAAVSAPSRHDVDGYLRLGARRAVLSPNGVDVAAWSWRPPTGAPVLGYVGQYGYRPNEAAALELVDEVLPAASAQMAGVRVSLVGRAPTQAMLRRSGPTVEVTGTVDDLAAHVQGFGVLVVPLRAGGGTRLKLLEAMAAGVPVVSTPLGAAGLDVQDGTHLLLAETAGELAAAAVRVLEDRSLARRLADAGRALVEERYDWSVTARPLVDCCAALLAERRRR